MEIIAQGDVGNAIKNQLATRSQMVKFKWVIGNFSRLNTEKLYSEIFFVGGYNWRILVFPKGNQGKHLSVYLDVANSSSLQYGWNIYAHFSLAVINQIRNNCTVRKDKKHLFNATETDWGFTSFMDLNELCDPGRGFIVNDTCVIESELTVPRSKGELEGKKIKKMEKAEDHLYFTIQVASDEDLVKQIGKDIHFDLVDHEKVRSFHIRGNIPFNHVKDEVAKEFGIPVQFQRFWMWCKRQNNTYRPFQALTHQEELQSVGQLSKVPNMFHSAKLNLFLENMEHRLDSQNISPSDETKEKYILLFFKLYDPEKEEISYVGRLLVKAMDKPTDILMKLNKMAGFAPDEELDIYEEIKFEPYVLCEPIVSEITFQSSQLENGDIVCFQKSLPGEYANQFRYPDVPSFLEYLHNCKAAASTVVSPQCISDADIEATHSQAEKIARSITSVSNSGMSLSSLDGTTKQEVLKFFTLIEMPFAELASSQPLQLVSCLTKIQTIAAAFFTQAQQEQVNQMASQVLAKVDQFRQFEDEIKAKNEYIASVRGISSSILTNNEKEAKLKQEEQLLAKEELELRANLERVVRKKLGVRQEREKLYAEMKDLLIEGTQIETATEDLRKVKLRLRSLSHEWDLFREHFANLKP